MRGLIYKDFDTLMEVYKKNLLLVAVLYGFMTVAMKNDFFLYFSIWMMGFYGLTAFSLDTQCGWDRYARTLPIQDWKIVAAKFVTGLLYIGIAVAYSIVMGVVSRIVNGTLAHSWGELLATVGLITAIVVASTSIMYFLAVKFSPEKARTYFVIVFMAIFAGFFLLDRAGILEDFPVERLQTFGLWLEGNAALAVLLALLAAAVVLLVMLAAACGVYRRKEF